MSDLPPQSSLNSLRPLLVMLLATGVIGAVLLILPPDLQRLIFYLMMLVALVIATPRVISWVTQRTSQFSEAQRTGSMRAIRRLSAVLSLVLVGLSAYYYQPQFSDTFTGFHFFLLSLPFIALASPIFQMPSPTHEGEATSSTDVIRPWALVLAVGLFALLMTINIPPQKKSELHTQLGLLATPTWIQMAILGGGLVSLLVGFGVSLNPFRFRPRRYHALLLAIVLLGGLVRAWQLETTLHVFVDEFFFMNDTLSIRDKMPEMLLPNFAPSTDIYPFFQAIFIDLMGPSLTSLRIVSPLICMGALLVLYAFARELFSLRVALISTLLFATLPVHIQFGRIGMNMIVDPIFGMLGFLFVLRGIRSGRVADYAVAGVAFGLTNYFYEAGRLFFTLFFICWLIWMAVVGRRDRGFRFPSLKQLAVLAFCLLTVMIPIYHTLLQFERTLTERLDKTRGPDFLLADRVREFLLSGEIGYLGAPLHRYVFTVADDNFYQSEYAYVLPIVAPFFLLGFGLLLWRIRTRQGALLIWWAVGVAIGNTIITDYLSAASPRHILVYAVLMLIVAVGLNAVWEWLAGIYQRRLARVVALVAIGYLVTVSVYQIDHYFNHVVPNYYEHVYGSISSTGRAKPAIDDMVLRAVTLPPNTSVQVLTDNIFPVTHHRVVPQFYERTSDEFIIQYKYIDEIDDAYFESLPRNVDYVFTFVKFHQNALLEQIEKYFTITRIEGSPFDVPESVEMLFAYAPLFDNPPPEPVDMPFERAPNAKP